MTDTKNTIDALPEGSIWSWEGEESFVEPQDEIRIAFAVPKDHTLVHESELDPFFQIRELSERTKDGSGKTITVTLGANFMLDDYEKEDVLRLTQPVFTIRHPTNSEYNQRIRLAWDFHRFSKSIFNTKEEDTVNILLFGMSGSGKSSYLNTLYSSLSTSPDPIAYAVAGGAEDHVTTKFVPYRTGRIEDGRKKQRTNFRVLDTWGLDRNNYENGQFEAILEGRMPPNTEMTDTRGASFSDNLSQSINQEEWLFFFFSFFFFFLFFSFLFFFFSFFFSFFFFSFFLFFSSFVLFYSCFLSFSFLFLF